MFEVKKILGIDRGEKRIGLAYKIENENLIFPLGYLENNEELPVKFSNIIVQHNIKKIILGKPKDRRVYQKWNKFYKLIKLLTPQEIEIILVNEEYSSVQAGNIKGNFKKDFLEDSIAAMVILENYLTQYK